MTSLLQDDVEWTPRRRREFLSTIDEETDRLNTLVGNLLDMSRIQTGRARARPRAPVGLDEVVPARARQPRRRAPTAIEVDVPETLPRVDADAALLERALANIVDNASAYSPAGRPVRVDGGRGRRTASTCGSSTAARASPPTSANACSSRSSASATPAHGDGSGLGLAVARGFVEAMGGEIEVEDTPGGGLTDGASRLQASRDDARPGRRRRAADPPRPGTNLQARGYDVDPAPTGEAALQLAARNHPDVVVLDLGLPGIDGVDVIRGLRGWTAIPIIVLSARDQEHDKVEALDAGADDYVTKPFGMDELLARLRAALRRAHRRRGSAVVATDDFTVDLAAKRVTAPTATIRLTPTEWHLVEILVRNPRQAGQPAAAPPGGVGPAVRGRDELPPRLHGADPAQARARPARPRYFITEPGMGYRFEVPESASRT